MAVAMIESEVLASLIMLTMALKSEELEPMTKPKLSNHWVQPVELSGVPALRCVPRNVTLTKADRYGSYEPNSLTKKLSAFRRNQGDVQR
jgi:hypothetical protein